MDLRIDARAILEAALKAADPGEAIRRHVHLQGGILTAGESDYDMDRYRRVFVVGAGKAAHTMAEAAEMLLGDRLTKGFVNVKDGHLAPVSRIHLHECSHPVPDERGVAGAREMAEIAASLTEDDLLICLLSGGASALLPFPARPLTLADKQETTRLLLDSGANIHEINAVRKHISSIKGGRLAALAFPATVLSLILSDVIGNDLDVIGSGVTAPDSSTFQTALEVLAKYNLMESVPRLVAKRLREGAAGEIGDTPKAGDPVFTRTQNLIVGSCDLALEAAAVEASARGYQPLILSSFIEGETREIARMHVAIAKEVLAFRRPVKPPCCLISGGETTVTLRGTGKGGRNLEFVLAAAIHAAGLPNTVILSAGTDGTDGPTDAAGAIADGSTVSRSLLSARQQLANNDSYAYFENLGDLVKTGPTGTNVMDIRLILIDTV